MIKILKEAKRIISQFFETEYWYRFRSLTPLWYDDEDQKYYKCSSLNKARDIITSTWEGENDILNTMILKIDQMFWSLKKYGIEKNYYIYGNDVIKYGTKEDKKFLINESLKQTFKDNHRIYVFGGNIDLENLGVKRCTFFLNYSDSILSLICTYKKEETVENILVERWKVENDDFGTLTSTTDLNHSAFPAVTKNYKITPHLKSTLLDDIVLSQLGASINYDFPINEVYRLSKGLREHAIGNFIKCRDLLHLRHLIKNILKIDDLNPKYNTWQKVKDEEKQQKIEECSKLFKSDRKKAYRRLTDFMAEKGLNWWD